jgi:hypothetical protein
MPSVGSAAAPAPANGGGQKRLPLPLPLLMLPQAQRRRGGGRGRPAMLPTNLNPARMALKDVIQWSNDVEREALLADKLRKVCACVHAGGAEVAGAVAVAAGRNGKC